DLGNALSSPSDRLSVNNCRHSTGLTLNRTEAYRARASRAVRLRVESVNKGGGNASDNVQVDSSPCLPLGNCNVGQTHQFPLAIPDVENSAQLVSGAAPQATGSSVPSHLPAIVIGIRVSREADPTAIPRRMMLTTRAATTVSLVPVGTKANIETWRRSRRNKVCWPEAGSSHRQEDDLVALLLCSMDALAHDCWDVATVDRRSGWFVSVVTCVALQLQLDLLAGLCSLLYPTDGSPAFEPDPGLRQRLGSGVETL